MTPEYASKRVYQNESGEFTQINITNTGNAEITLNITIDGNVSQYVSPESNSITLPYAQSTTLKLNYTTGDVLYNDNATGIVLFNLTGGIRENASIKETYANLSLLITPYSARIVYPTQSNATNGTAQGISLQTKVNVTENGTIARNVTFIINIFNNTMSSNATITSYYNVSDGWIINFTAPNLTTGKAYGLNVTATANNTYYNVRSVAENKSVVYNDTTAPVISLGVYERVPINGTQNITINITEYGGIKNITSSIKLPSNATLNFTPTLIAETDEIYRYVIYFNDTSFTGTYIANVTVCDKSSNCATSGTTFEIYPTVTFAGNTTDMESATISYLNMAFSLLNAGGQQRFAITSVNGTYNETIDAKYYDVILTFSGNTVSLNNSRIDTNYYNPIVIGYIPKIRTTLTALKGIYVDSSLSHMSGKITFDFSDAQGSILIPEHLSIYKYSSTWIPKISSSQNTLWTKISNVNGNNDDHTINMTSLKVEATTSNIDGAYILAEFICGDGNCESSYGETTNNCPIDCPSLPPTPPQSGGGSSGGGSSGGGSSGGSAGGGAAGGGAAGGGGGGAAAAATASTSQKQAPITIKSTLVETMLYPGEEKMFSVDVTNNGGKELKATISVEGPLFNLLTIQKPAISLKTGTTEVVAIKATASATTAPGIYNGEVVITTDTYTHRIPVTVTVQTILQPLMDVKIKALTKYVSPGEDLIFEMTLLNMGETAKVDDITVTYSVRNLKDQSKLISTSKETVAVDNVLTFRKNINIPSETPEDKYIVEASATYWYGKNYATSSDDFEVSSVPMPLIILKALFANPITYIVLFAGFPIGMLGYRYIQKRKLTKKAKARYIAPMDFKLLPKAGPNAIEVGKIAETDVRTYIDIPQLIMHSIAAGGTGSGKSVSAMVCAEELLKRKVPVIVFDPTAQWTGFMKPCRLKLMLDLYPNFKMKPTDAMAFKTNIVVVDNPDMPIEIKNYMKPGEMTVFVMNRLGPGQLDGFVIRSIQSIFDTRPGESKEIKLLLVYDEVHRLLPKYGGKKGYTSIERGCREFRKWGIGIFLISQVLLDFKSAVRANIANEIQLRTKYEGDIGRVKSKYGVDYASKVTRLTIGTGLFQNPEYNNGRPWFISFRPLLHSPFALTDDEINKYVELNKRISDVEERMKKLDKKVVYDIEVELNITKDKMKTAAFKMAETYLESIEKRMQKLEVGK
jgi:uncharacterized membrane protein YgcG